MRRLIVFVLLFVLVTIGAVGLGGLLGRLFEAIPGNLPGGVDALAGDGTSGLAQSLAFTLIGGPLAAVLWWAVWRRAGDAAERAALTWGLYLAGMTTVALITSATALLATVASLVEGEWRPRELGTGLVWAAVWVWHARMARHPEKSPLRLITVSLVVGAAYGLVVATANAVTLLSGLFDVALRESAQTLVGDPWWTITLKALVWAVGGAAIWWWYWSRLGARRVTTTFAAVALVLVGVLGASLLALGGFGVLLYLLLRLVFDRVEPLAELLDPAAAALAAALVGLLVWVYHRAIAERRTPATRQAGRLVTSAAGLAAAASGIGIVVNSLLATFGQPLVGGDLRPLLLGGLSSLIIGGPVWWFTWRPTEPAAPRERAFAGRRVYLITVFGLSAVAAIITLLIIGFQVFEFVLDPVVRGSLLDRVRAPLGVLVAATLVAGYHFGVWRSDRAVLATDAPARARTIARVTLVIGAATGDGAPEAELVAAVRDATGAQVTVWRVAGPGEASIAAPDLVQALVGVMGNRVLVICGPAQRIEVIPLAD
ncbi:hypothetical protein E3T55_19330 [Cryobacterium frigoriphilum]|uniref:DUF5671 domain-containing protein n=1 Tax=Cryobacterium frigoriphilum TaxID=1259150 RepID=A0A4R8ZTJ9_9MICO|nr:hypothetical protein E3T55_19330 [Cryobacterium frigoriphilum]